MADIEIICINKVPRENKHEGITHLGSVHGKSPRADIISWIETGTHSFYTLVGGRRGNIGVVNGPNGKYVRTHADGTYNDNLLALPECR